ncbi:MAG: hypothetical protein PHR25_05885 [Clostridia bacterium]|nr:hypothetical protein [Clostridia bacterium]
MTTKNEKISIRTTKRRQALLKDYAKKVEKNQTQVLEDFIDSLESKLKKENEEN